MAPPYEPPNRFNDDNAHDVPSKLDKGKRKAEGMSRANKAVAEIDTGGDFDRAC